MIRSLTPAMAGKSPTNLVLACSSAWHFVKGQRALNSGQYSDRRQYLHISDEYRYCIRLLWPSLQQSVFIDPTLVFACVCVCVCARTTSHTASTSTRWHFAFGAIRICSV